ncbi:MAG: hypothetical protein U5K71_13205 [Gracilimonas sp.]|nr:hypothetical protein [Gracilimonas sp.]
MKSGKPADGRDLDNGDSASVALIDTAKYNPVLEQESEEKVFQAGQ